MANKLTVTRKKMAALGLKKTERGEYGYIGPLDKNRSIYKPVKKDSK